MRLTKKLATLAIRETSPPLRGQRLEAGQIGLGDLLIDLLREQQRDVDVDALADQVADRRQALPASPGTLIIRFGRSTARHSRRASAMVPSVSLAR